MLQFVKHFGLPMTKPTTSLRLNSYLWLSLLIALSILGIWAGSTITLMTVDINQISWWAILPAMLWQIFLYTGVFITAHDAMHGVVAPRWPWVNDLIGQIALTIYAFFDYKQLRDRHHLHHSQPASQADPDFHKPNHGSFWQWYLGFMVRNWGWQQLLCSTLAYNAIKYVFHLSDWNLTLFWVIPSLISSLQLFYFGTYLPHREPEGGHIDDHRATSCYSPWLISLLSCYHFGYHWEHHEYPSVPWWLLPAYGGSDAVKSPH